MKFSMSVRSYVYDYLLRTGKMPKKIMLSSHFHVSESTIFRNLRKEGMSYKKIKREIRSKELKYLINKNIKPTAVSAQIGYSSLRSYYRFTSDIRHKTENFINNEI